MCSSPTSGLAFFGDEITSVVERLNVNEPVDGVVGDEQHTPILTPSGAEADQVLAVAAGPDRRLLIRVAGLTEEGESSRPAWWVPTG